MAEGVLAALEKEYRPLLAPKLLAEAKAAQVVWARVKGYPAWPAQVLTEAAALRRKDLGQERHSKGNSVPVMFFGTVEVAWVKDADVVDFKEGLYQGFFDRKTKPFKLALEQVCEYLALDRKRKAPPKWWCKPPSNGLDEQPDGPSSKPASASGSGAAKAASQRQEGPKGARQRNSVPGTDSDTSEEDDAPGSQAGGRNRPPKGGSVQDGRQTKEAAAPVKPRASSAGRAVRDNGSTAASTSTAAQAQAKKPPTAPQAAPTRVLKEPAKPGKEGPSGGTAGASDAKAAPASRGSQQQQRAPSGIVTSLPAGKESDSGGPSRKRIKVEPAQAAAVGPAAASASNMPPPPPAAAVKRTTSVGEDLGELDARVSGEVDILKLPAEIRRLAGIRVPALPKKPGLKVEESPREHPLVKAEKGPVLAANHAPPGSAKATGVEGTGRTLRAARSSRVTKPSNRPGQSDGGQGKAAAGKRTRREQSSSAEEAQSAESSKDESSKDESSKDESSEDESSDDEEDAQSSGDEAESDAGSSSSSGNSSDEASEVESDDDTVVANARRGTVAAATRQQAARVKAQSQPPPSRDRRGEKQRRLARLSAPEPANRRTSARLVPKTSAEPESRKAVSEDLEAVESEKESEDGEGEDERSSSAEATSSSSDESDSEEKAEHEQPGTEKLRGSGDEGIKQRLRTRSSHATRPQPHLNPDAAARKVPAVPTSQPPSREASQPPDQRAKATSSRADTDVETADDDKKPQGRDVSSVVAPAPTKAIPLELRRLQTSPSAGLPVVNTRPRTLRDRSSPSKRAVVSTGVTTAPTATAGTTTGTKRCDKRGSEDGSGASMSPAMQRTRSPEHRRDGQKAGSAMDARASPNACGVQALDGRSSKASSLAGSASPPPVPAPGAVPVRKKPPSLGVPSTARSAGQAGARQLPAITPARAVLRSLASTGDVQHPNSQPASGCAGSSAAGQPATNVAVCVAKKPSTGPPTRRLVEPGLDAPASSTDVPEMGSLNCEADAKHVFSPDVATAGPAATRDGDGAVLRSPDAASLDGSRPESRTEEAGCDQPPGKLHLEQLVERHSSPRPTVEDGEDTAMDQVGGNAEDGAEHAGGQSVSNDAGPDVPMPDVRPAAADLHQEAGEVAMSRVEAMEVEEQSPEQSRQQAVTQPDVMEPIPLQPQQPREDLDRKSEPDVDPVTEQLDPHPSSVNQQGLTNASHEPEPVEQGPGLATGNSVACDDELEPGNQSPARTPSAAEKLPQVAVEQAASALAPQARSGPGSPVVEEVLLTEEQLPDQAEAMAEHDGRPDLPEPERHVDCGSSAGAPVCTAVHLVAAAEVACEVPSMRSPVHATEAGEPLAGQVADGGVSAQPPCAGSRASSDAGGEEAPPAGVSGASCSAPIWGEDEDAAARARAQELEELGEVAAALANLSQQPAVPPLSLIRAASQPVRSQLAVAAHLETVEGTAHGRGLARCGGQDDKPLTHGSAALAPFRWPQPEPLLPSREQPFALPHDWLLTRPPRYEPVKRNVWHSRSKPKRLPKDEINICACRPPPFAAPGELQRMGCGSSCLNRLSSILCDSKLCPCGELCSNRSLHLLRQPKTEVFLTENRGWGVRAMEPLSKGAFIIEYAGEVIDERELGRRMEHARMNGEPHFYIMELSSGLYIDARRKGNIARLINSSCDPNCETQKWHDASTGEVRVGIFAVRDIGPGEELVYDYFFSAYGALKQSAASFVCMCGSKNCRGTMDLHPEKRRDLGRRLEVFWDADEKYYRAVVVAYHPTSKKHTVMYEDGGTEKLCLDEVPHRWLDDDHPRTSPQKPGAPHGDSAAAAEPAAAEPSQRRPELPAMPQVHAQRLPRAAQVPELAQQRRHSAAAGETADLPMYGTDRGRCVPIAMVASQAPPRPIIPIDQRCLLPPLGTTPAEASTSHSQGQLGKHGLQESEFHLPLKKRQRMMQQLPQSAPHYAPSQASPRSNALGASGIGGEGPSGAAQPQVSADSAGGAVAPAPGHHRQSGGGADSGSAEPMGLTGRSSYRHEMSGTGSGRVSSVAADEDDPNEDLDSLLEAAEAVAALRTAPISTAPSVNAPQDSALPLQPRYIRSGSVPSAGGAAAVAMVQTAKVPSPRHLAAVHRAGPPNGLPPHSGSRSNGSLTAHPSSSSSGFIPYHPGSSKHHHVSGGGNTHNAATNVHDGGYGGHSDSQHQRHHQPNGRNGRFSGDPEAAMAGGAVGYGKNGNGYGKGYGSQSGGDVNREDLLWKLVGIEKPKDLLPLFSKSRNGDDAKGRRGGSDSWIAPSHPYGKLLRALETSELLAQADQARLNAQHVQQQQRVQPLTQSLSHPQSHLPAQQANPQPPPQQPHPRLHQQQQLAGASSKPVTAAEARALSAWQQVAHQPVVAHPQLAQQQQQQHPTAAHGASYVTHAFDTGSVAALLQQQQVAAAAVAAAASAGQLHSLHALQSHVAAAAAGGGAAGTLSGHHVVQQPLAAAAAAAPHWHQPVHGQPGSIIQDLIQMYVAQHSAAGSHPALAIAGTATVGGGRS